MTGLLRIRLLAVGLLLSVVAACSSTPPPAPPAVQVPESAGVYKVGKPYEINNVWYYPREQPNYDETGIASWYGPNFYGKQTANGEIYDGDKLTAAHRTLPMPVNVRVTNLENGKSIVVRVNDRGPYSKGRIIDVSRRAAELLGFIKQGTARVRVTYLGRADVNGQPVSETPAAIANALPAAPTGQVNTSQLAAVPGTTVENAPLPPAATPKPESRAPVMALADNQPDGTVTTVPVPAETRLYVQVGAFAQLQNAHTMRQRLGNGLVISTLHRGNQTLYRVRSGPFNTVAQADAELARLVQAGAKDAQIIVDQ